MINLSPIDLRDAMRLMRDGRLQDATGAIQQTLATRSGGAGLRPRPSAAATPAPPGARFTTATYRGPCGERDYRLYHPAAAATATEPLPLLLMLHGCTQTADDFAVGTGMNHVAERYGWLVAYPQQSSAANPSRCWNWFRGADQQRGRGEAALLAGLTRQLLERHRVDRRRVYIAGLSAGGAMAAVLAAVYADLYTAAGVHSGLAYGSAGDLGAATAAMRQGPAAPHPLDRGQPFVPLIVLHGDRDVTVHPRNGEHIIAQGRAALRAGGVDTQALITTAQTPDGRGHTRTRYIDVGGRVLLEHWSLHGTGHAWSGGSPNGSHTDPRGPDAAAAMAQFFAAAAPRD